MPDLSALLSAADVAHKEIEAGKNIDALAVLIESQISNVIGGGYSQYCAWHCKDMQ